jgi:DNA-binding NtrC family response regulator/tetratricopeptide (TPR) repeat protein
MARALSETDYLVIQGPLDDITLAMAHDWLSLVISHQLDTDAGRDLRRNLARRVESVYLETQDGTLLETLVRQLTICGDIKAASSYLTRAVEFLEAAHLYGKAGDLLLITSFEESKGQREWPVLKKTAELLYLSGEFRRCRDLAKNAIQSSGALETQQIAWLLHLTSTIQLLQGHVRKATELSEKALEYLGESDEPTALQVKAQLLCGVSQAGLPARARALARDLLLKMYEGSQQLTSKIWHALCLYYQFTEGDHVRAIESEAKSLKLSLSGEPRVRLAGRLIHLASLQCENNQTESADKTLAFASEMITSLGNSQLEIFASVVRCVILRKRGKHHDALAQLGEVLTTVRSQHQNRHLEIEILAEYGRNSNHLGFYQEGLKRLSEAVSLLKNDPLVAATATVSLTSSWSHLLSADPDEALRVASVNTEDWAPWERGRNLLLRAQAHLEMEETELSWKAAEAAEREFPPYMLYYQVRVLLLKGEILKRDNNLEAATTHFKEALDSAKRRFYLPLMAKAYGLYGSCLAEQGEPRKARAYCLRGAQISRKVERPRLQAQIRSHLGDVEVRLNEPHTARRSYGTAIRLLKEIALNLPASKRQSFLESYIRPIETKRDQLRIHKSSSTASSFQTLRQLIEDLKGAKDLRNLAERVVDAVKATLPPASANFLVKEADGTVKIIASRGHCKRTGRHAFSSDPDTFPNNSDAPNISNLEGESRSISLRLPLGLGLRGILYIETAKTDLSETEVDYLGCIGHVLELASPESRTRTSVEVPKTTGLTLDKNRQIVGAHPRMTELFDEIRTVAKVDATVLIYGESGTGKELVAKAIHLHSTRSGRPFVPVNCSAFPPDLVESELFGHAQGAFTGADRARQGLFEATAGGTILLDEISTMPLGLQPRLLRVLEQRKIRRVGETREQPIDIRVVAAANQPLEDLVERKLFRPDLYHRLNVYQIRIPPLRERISDLELLVQYFLTELNKNSARKKAIMPEALATLSSYPFPGNVRELRNLIESAYVLSKGRLISAHDIEKRLSSQSLTMTIEERSSLDRLFEDLVAGRADFWSDVRDPFLSRELCKREVRYLIVQGLTATGGHYRRLVTYFNLSQEDYRRFLSFLSHHDCKVDFRPFRRHLASI